ncbi:ABC transporter ATP-binding protein [Vreelandella olivaria]|uniref:ABC transporter ATP-binding protein n=1 Tax=Vreelandella olivaria TaxID=390919 RepID=UPI00201F953F|nr:ABC transporter ATP-binding protein [Halomonas olivaria]
MTENAPSPQSGGATKAAAAESQPDPTPANAHIRMNGVSLTFKTARRDVQALQHVDLDIAEGEFIALLGPTGCGKSSLLRLVCDLLQPTEGQITVRGRPPTEARRANDFGFVFQEPALLANRTALENVRLPLEVVGYPAEQRSGRCETLLESVGLLGFKDAYPHELSGGMRQRVAIVRALAWNPPIVLMDEPFSALDEITKEQLQDDLLELWNREKKTILFVTHNITEAVYLADRVVIMSSHPGRVRSIIPVELPRPRGNTVRETSAFLSLVRKARKELTQ